MMKKIVIGIFSLILIEAFFYGQIFAQDTSDQWKDPDPNCIRHAENGACANYKETSTPTSSSSI
ncbi:MAG: hypothetical protein LBD11_06305 [Candidatus Peribacteria bacterium]|jgi:hypothetical protein|nr:hypothetical protein [Candidatus Peribacteria bacterium]